MGAMASQITSLTIVYLTVFFQAQIKENIKAPRHWLCAGNSPVTGEFPHKWPVTRKMFPFDGVIMIYHNVAWVIWPKFCRRYFQMNFLQGTFLFYNSNFTASSSSGFTWQYTSVGFGNSLVPSGNKPLPEPILWRYPTTHNIARPQYAKMRLHLHFHQYSGLTHLGQDKMFVILQFIGAYMRHSASMS